MFIPDPGSEFFHPGSRNLDPGSLFASKNLGIFNPKSCLGNMARDVHPDFFFHPGSWDQKGTGSRICNTGNFTKVLMSKKARIRNRQK
jgi:hypothetical protein